MSMSVVSPPRFTSFSFFLVVILASLSLLVSSVLSVEPSSNTLEIGSAEDLIAFSSNVNSGTNYSGTTILLTNDIYFNSESSDRFYPIGNISSLKSSIMGIFNGHGYTINNLKITKGSEYFGLFGFSFGGSIKNIILASSCEVFSQRNHTPYVSGIIGLCNSDNDKSCSVLNSVNMASVLYNGTCTGPPLHIGGIAGNFQGFMKNCVNFGTITVNGEIGSAYIGGIAGYTSSDPIISNCINHGTIFHNGNTSNLYIGGISGHANSGTSINNCVNMGEISVEGTVSGNSYIGSITGNIASGITISNCYWDDSINYSCAGYEGGNSKISSVSSFNSSTLQLNETIIAGGYTGKSLIHALNAFTSTEANLSKWVENGNTPSSVSFFINNRGSSIFATVKKVVLLPNLADGTDNVFHGWFTDMCLNKSFDNMTIPSGTTTLYGRYGDFTPQQQECEAFSSSSTASSLPSSSSSSSSTSIQQTTSTSSSSSSSTPTLSSLSSSNPTPSEYVEIVFAKKNITREEAIEIIKEIVGNDNFDVVEFEDTVSGKRVVLKFKDVEKAKTFVNSAERYGREEGSNNYIKGIGFIDKKDVSLSSFKVPSLLMLLLSFILF